MSLFTPKGFGTFVAATPAGTVVEQWESHVGKVGGKVFALLSGSGAEAALTFKVSELSFAGLSEIEGIGQAPYFAKGQWVSVAKGALTEAQIKAYILESRRLVAAKLTKKARAELGIES